MSNTIAKLSLKPGLRVLVTAAAAGIGRATAEGFLANGAKVHACDIDGDGLARLLGENHGLTGTVCDVAEPEAIDRLFQDASGHLGGLDVLVNNAGVAGPTGPVEELSLDDWRRTLAINLDSHFLCVQRAVPLMKQAGGRAIINLSSAAGKFGFPLRTPYCSSKWAVVGFSLALAAELGTHNIRVNAVLPGPVQGDRINRVIEAKAKQLGITFEQMHNEYVSFSSLRRMVAAQDIANTILFLSSPAGENISGQAISVDAGVEHIR